MSSSQALYSITITNSSGSTAPRDGFVDNKRIEDYYTGTDLKVTPSGLNFNLCKAKRRGNMRYHDIINQLSLVSNCYVDDTHFSSDADDQNEATAFQFYIIIEHGEDSLITADESNPGDFLTGTDCVKRCVARALFNDMTRNMDVIDPTSTTFGVGGGTQSVPRVGIRTISLESGAYGSSLSDAESCVDVTAIDFLAFSL